VIYFFSHIFPWPIVVVGAYFTFTAIQQMIGAASSGRWPSLEARIVKSAVEITDSGGDYPVTLYVPDIHYKYSVDGVSHTRQRVALTDINPGSQAKADAVIKRYPPGKAVRVYVSPRDPAMTILEPGLRWPMAGKLIFGLAMLGAGAALLVVLGGAGEFIRP
jgi:hypothetical protein